VRPEEESLYRIPAKQPRLLLEWLSSLARRREEGEEIPLPLIELHLSSGRRIKGFVIRLVTDDPQENSNVLLFHVPGPDPGQPRFHLAYIDPRIVEGITVEDADTVAHWISFGTIPAPEPVKPAPSRLEINRRLGELSKSLASDSGWSFQADIDGEGIPGSGAAWQSMAELIHLGMAVLKELLGDPMAKEALEQSVQRVRFGNGPQPGVTLSDGMLCIRADLLKGFEGRLRRDNLQAAIAKVL
jgi:hypothetical protein